MLVAAGVRVIAPDNIGFGRSDKPARPTDYTFARHIEWTRSLVTGLDLRDVTLVAQDWGGPIGFSVLAAEPDRFARVVAANTILHTADPALADRLTWAVHGVGRRRGSSSRRPWSTTCSTPSAHPSCGPATSSAPPRRRRWRRRCSRRTTRRTPRSSYTAGLRQMTALLPLTRNDVGARIGRRTMRALEQFDRPFVTAYSDGDPATRGWETVFQERVPGARGRSHVTIAGAGHFLQEDAGERLGQVVADVIATT